MIELKDCYTDHLPQELMLFPHVYDKWIVDNYGWKHRKKEFINVYGAEIYIMQQDRIVFLGSIDRAKEFLYNYNKNPRILESLCPKRK